MAPKAYRLSNKEPTPEKWERQLYLIERTRPFSWKIPLPYQFSWKTTVRSAKQFMNGGNERFVKGEKRIGKQEIN